MHEGFVIIALYLQAFKPFLLKGKSAIYIARNFEGRQRNFPDENLWVRGYYVSTVGKDEKTIKAYINWSV